MRRRRRVAPGLASLDHLRIHAIRSSSAKQELAVIDLRADRHLLASRNEDRVAGDKLHVLTIEANGDLTTHTVQELVIARGPVSSAVALALAESDMSDSEVPISLNWCGEW